MWGKLPFLLVLVGVLGVYSGDAFGDWYCGNDMYLTVNNQCAPCPSGYSSLSVDEPGDEADCWILGSNGSRIYYEPDANGGNTGGGDSGTGGGSGPAQAGVRPGQNNGSGGGGMSHGGSSGGGSGTPDNHGCYNGQYYSNGDCQGCPRGYPNSDKNATIIEQCYKVNGHSGGKLYYGVHAQCRPGMYLPKNTTSCKNCEDGYRCPGGTFAKKNEDQGRYPCDEGLVSSEDHTQCVEPGSDPTPENCTISGADSHCCKSGQAFQGQGQYYSNGQCTNCPSGFRNIEQNKTSSDDCFTQGAGGARLYYKKVSCPVGQYLPAGRGWNGQNNGCAACPSDDTVNYCPGISNKYPNLSNAQGLVPCPNNQVPSSDHKTCQNSSGGGSGTFTCSVGNYLPAYATTGCVKCTDIHKYCPGGQTYTTKSYDQGIFDCPPNAVASSDWSTCNVKLSQIKMKFGPNGTATKLQDQCWLRTGIKDYAKCEFPNTASLQTYSYRDDSQVGNAVQQEENQR